MTIDATTHPDSGPPGFLLHVFHRRQGERFAWERVALMSSAVYGLALLIIVDVALFAWGRRILDSGVVDSTAGYPLSKAWSIIFFVWVIHLVGSLFAWGIMGDMAAVFFSSILTAIPAAVVWGIFGIHATTTQIERIAMGKQKRFPCGRPRPCGATMERTL